MLCEESTPAPPEVCLRVTRALQAAIEYLRSGDARLAGLDHVR